MQEDNEGEKKGMRSVTMAMNLGNVVRNYARTPLWKCGEEGLEIPSQLWPWRGRGGFGLGGRLLFERFRGEIWVGGRMTVGDTPCQETRWGKGGMEKSVCMCGVLDACVG